MSDNHETAVAVIEHHETDRVSPAVRAIIDARVSDPETARQMLAVQREWEADNARKAFAVARTALMRDMPKVVRRDQTVAFGNTRYTHASLAQVLETVTPHLAAHGFSLNWEPATEGDKVTVTCRMTHTQGHCETCTISAPIDNKGSKSPAQGAMSTITMLERYTAMSLLGLASADMHEPKTAPTNDINKARNQKAIAALGKYGKSKADAEDHLGKPWDQWTGEDLAALKTWLQDEPADKYNYGPPPMSDEQVAEFTE